MNLSHQLVFQRTFTEYGPWLFDQGELLHLTLDHSWLDAVGTVRIDQNVTQVATRYQMR